MKGFLMNFVSDFIRPEKISDDSLWFLFSDQKIVTLSENEKRIIPEYSDLKEHGFVPDNFLYMGSYGKLHCYTSDVSTENEIHGPFSLHPPLSLVNKIDEDLVRIAGLGNQLVYWSVAHRLCGRCGNLTEDKKDERAKVCPDCGQIYYPRLSPAIIVAVLKDDKILLAHSQRFPAKFYSVLAGFVEPGENLEECVKREVREETGIEIKNIKYFGSQPWPFPDSLMIAFTAEYEGGEIKVDETEIADAGWYAKEEIPRIPPSISIARKLIDWFLECK
ncbi:NAD(+) diphosphatase [Thermodesulfobacteriota bacterium]